jgi:general L-amino acid transport system permease protein
VELGSLARVQIALTLFTAAYMAEAIRGGLQAVPHGQLEAARALGLSRVQANRTVVLPQALRASLPGLVNTAISEVKNTTLVLIVGMFDLLQTTRQAFVAVEWRPYFVEAYAFTAAVFFVLCFTISQLSLKLERHLESGASRAVAPTS